MKRQWSDLKYDRETNCWFVVLDGKEYGMHCGEWFDLFLSDTKSMVGRLELAKEWYVDFGSVRFNLRKQETYKIEF